MVFNKSKLHGSMTTDYFEFFCPKCQGQLLGMQIIEEEMTGYFCKAMCRPCDETFNFKLARDCTLKHEENSV